MNWTRFGLAAFAAFVVMMAYDFVVHGILLRDIYMQTASLWRPQADMDALMGYGFASKFGLAVMLTWIFAQNYEARGYGEGVRYGLGVGVIMGLVMFESYVYLPISLTLGILWLVANTGLGLVAGLTLAAVYRK